jgi:hypothetical protein
MDSWPGDNVPQVPADSRSEDFRKAVTELK